MSESTARSVAYALLRRIESEGAYANLVLGAALDRSHLTGADRRFVTDLVYGTTRMRRACDALVDRFVTKPPDAATRTLLRLGAYQLEFGGVPAHAAVSETVGLAPNRVRGFVNAVLRRVAATPMVWPSELTRLSYPDWIGELLIDELGAEQASSAMVRMNEPAHRHHEERRLHPRPLVAMGGGRGRNLAGRQRARRLCRTGWQGDCDRRRRCPRHSRRRAPEPGVVGCRQRQPGSTPMSSPSSPMPHGNRSGHVVFDAVLIDAPCSGLGALRRRPDARWRIQPDDVAELAALQRRILESSAALVRPGGRLVYSVCTLTTSESIDHPIPDGFEIDARVPPAGTWQPFRHGWRVLPHEADTDGMVLIRYRRQE